MSGKLSCLSWKRMGKGRKILEVEMEKFASLKGRIPLFDESPGQPDFKKLWSHPKISSIRKRPGHRLLLRTKKEHGETVEKEVLVYNGKNELCAKLVWNPAEGERFSLIN